MTSPPRRGGAPGLKNSGTPAGPACRTGTAPDSQTIMKGKSRKSGLKSPGCLRADQETLRQFRNRSCRSVQVSCTEPAGLLRLPVRPQRQARIKKNAVYHY